MRRSIPGRAARAATLIMTACAALALTACTANSSTGSGANGTLKAEDSPLSKWWASFSGDEEFSEEDYEAQMQAVEEKIATCMQEQGFEYTPMDNGGVVVFGGEDGPEWGTKEWAAQYGYQAFYVGEEADEVDPGEEFQDPNQAYVEAMSESERTAYYTALFGETFLSEEDPEEDLSTIAPEDQGCSGKAWEGVTLGSAGDIFGSEEWMAIEEEMETLEDSITTDPAMKAADAKWADCMADAGYSAKNWTKPSEPEQWYHDEATRLWDEANAATEGLDPEEISDDDRVDPTTSDEWQKRSEEEKDTAVADYTCRETSGWEQAQLRVRFDAEQKFIDTHKDQLDKIVAMYEESSK